MSEDPVLLAEREHQASALECLEQMRAGAQRIADYGVDALASESLGRLRAQRLEHLAGDAGAPPFFGRTDRDSPAEILHIGRRHLRDDTGDPVVIDWRAPIARAFYRATPTDRQGVTLRRRFGFSDGLLTSFEDEHLDRGQANGLDSQLLRDEIERPRVGPMRDIVATIQPDQDVLVRADLDTSLCIQGAPGTGKTAVGLHRAAYLLYTYPERLRRSGVLVVGPNKAFLRYIAQVLPALGENGITQSTVDELVGSDVTGSGAAGRAGSGRAVSGTEDIATAVLKGDARMAALLRRAVFSHIAKPDADVVALNGTKRYRVQVERARRYVDDARRSCAAGELRWNSGRDRLQNLIAQDVRRQREDAGGAPSDAETSRVAKSAPVRAFVDAVWPKIVPAALLIRLFTDAEFLSVCAAGSLSEAELALLQWPATPKSVRSARFSAADLVLLDELAGLLSAPDSYVHVVLDEAQDLSSMQCRAVARRCLLGSVTVLGDLAQATTPWAAGSWQQTLTELGKPDTVIAPLTVGYRVPGAVLEVANRLLPHIAVDVPPATSVRGDADALSMSSQLIQAVTDCLASEGSIAVIAADATLAAIGQELSRHGIAADPLDTDPLDINPLDTNPLDRVPARVTLVAASAAKGLEYDSVVLVEPADIIDAEPSRLAGLRRLYVAWTRAVSRLAVVHLKPLPPELD